MVTCEHQSTNFCARIGASASDVNDLAACPMACALASSAGEESLARADTSLLWMTPGNPRPDRHTETLPSSRKYYKIGGRNPQDEPARVPGLTESATLTKLGRQRSCGDSSGMRTQERRKNSLRKRALLQHRTNCRARWWPIRRRGMSPRSWRSGNTTCELYHISPAARTSTSGTGLLGPQYAPRPSPEGSGQPHASRHLSIDYLKPDKPVAASTKDASTAAGELQGDFEKQHGGAATKAMPPSTAKPNG